MEEGFPKPQTSSWRFEGCPFGGFVFLSCGDTVDADRAMKVVPKGTFYYGRVLG